MKKEMAKWRLHIVSILSPGKDDHAGEEQSGGRGENYEPGRLAIYRHIHLRLIGGQTGLLGGIEHEAADVKADTDPLHQARHVAKQDFEEECVNEADDDRPASPGGKELKECDKSQGARGDCRPKEPK